MIRAPNRAKMMIVAAVAQEVRNGFLQHDRGAERVGELQPANALEITTGRAPPNPERRRERFPERAAQDYTTIGVPSLEGLGPAFAKVQIAVNVILDRGNIELRKNLVEFLL